MGFFVILLGILSAVLSTAMLSYISMATMVGPWIGPVLVLLANPLLRLQRKRKSSLKDFQKLILIQAIGAVGGVIAIGIGFALPVLFFLDKTKFYCWLNTSALYYHLPIITLCFSAGSLGIFLGRSFSNQFIKEERFPFPISHLTYSSAISPSQKKQTKQIFTGIFSTLSLCFLRDGFLSIKGFFPKIIYPFSNYLGKTLAISIWPTLWAIGFTTGKAIVVPLFTGLVSKYFVLYPLNHHSEYLPLKLFSVLPVQSFALAFCAGLVLAELATGMLKTSVLSLIKIIKNPSKLFISHSIFKNLFKQTIEKIPETEKNNCLFSKIANIMYRLEPIIAFTSSIIFLSLLGFSPLAQAVLLISTILATYEINRIGGQIGLVQFGRFATFVLIPMLLIFKLNPFQITAICLFFNICAATSSDLLFDYKTGELSSLDKPRLYLAQWIGLITTSLCISLILYLLFSNFTIGSADLFAQRGRTKALLVQALDFNGYIVCLGLLYGFALKKLKISPTMTLGGIIMPNSISIGIILGGATSLLVKKKNEVLPFCSGVLACESLWIIVSAVLKII